MSEDRRKIITHKEKSVIVHDYSGLEGNAFVEAILRNSTMVENEERTNRLVLIDVTDTVVNKEVMKAFKQLTKGQSQVVKRGAVLGLTGIQTLFVQMITSFTLINIKPFESKEDALDWLTE